MTNQMPEYTKEVWLFNKKFGTLGIEESTDKFAYGTEDRQFTIPSTATKEYLTELIHKSLVDNHDYLLDFVKEHGEEIVYKKGIIY